MCSIVEGQDYLETFKNSVVWLFIISGAKFPRAIILTLVLTEILAMLLNDGTSPQTGKTILSPETVREMFTNQLPQDPEFARQYMHAVKQDLVYPVEELYPLCPASSPQGWGLTFMISPGLTGRSKQTVHWSGLSNVFWWCDRENGVAGIVASQVLPFPDPSTVKLWVDVEAKVYEGLKR